MFIESPSNGYKAEINEENRIKAECVAITSAHHANHHEKEAYSFRIDVTPTGAGDCIGYIKNNSNNDMVIEEIVVAVDSNETIIIKIGDIGTPSGGSSVSLTNLNAGAGNIADVTAESGVDITGLSGGAIAMGFFVKGGESSMQFPIPPSFIIPKNQTISFYVKTGAIPVLVGALITFHNHA